MQPRACLPCFAPEVPPCLPGASLPCLGALTPTRPTHVPPVHSLPRVHCFPPAPHKSISLKSISLLDRSCTRSHTHHTSLPLSRACVHYHTPTHPLITRTRGHSAHHECAHSVTPIHHTRQWPFLRLQLSLPRHLFPLASLFAPHPTPLQDIHTTQHHNTHTHKQLGPPRWDSWTYQPDRARARTHTHTHSWTYQAAQWRSRRAVHPQGTAVSGREIPLLCVPCPPTPPVPLPPSACRSQSSSSCWSRRLIRPATVLVLPPPPSFRQPGSSRHPLGPAASPVGPTALVLPPEGTSGKGPVGRDQWGGTSGEGPSSPSHGTSREGPVAPLPNKTDQWEGTRQTQPSSPALKGPLKGLSLHLNSEST